MSFLDWLAQPAGRMLTLTLLHFVWQGVLVVVCLAILVKLFSVRRSSTRYACSLAALVAMAAFPIATLAWISLAHDPTPFSHVPITSDASIRLVNLDTRIDTTPFYRDSRSLEALQPYALVVWLGGVLFFGSRLLAGAVGIARLRRSRLPLPDELRSRVARLGARLQIDALPLVFLSKDVAEAMALGLFRRLVLIPATWATEMPPEMLEAVIAHELAHLRRMDLWANLLQRIVETLFFYHPAVWWLSRRLAVERELSSDELAVAATGERLVYAQTLEHIAAGRQADIRPALAAFLRGESNMRLLQRIRNVLAPPSSDRRHWPAGLAAVGTALCLWLLSLSLLDTFTPAAYADETTQHEASGETDQNDDASEEESSIEEEPNVAVDVELEFQLEEDANAEEESKVEEESEDEHETDIERELAEAIDSDLIQRKVDEAIKKALAKLETKKAKAIEKAQPKLAESINKARSQAERLAKEVEKRALRAREAQQVAHAKQLVAELHEKAQRESAKQREHAQRLAAEAQEQVLRHQAELVKRGELQERYSKQQLYQLQRERELLDKALHQQANDQRIEKLTAMVHELSAQVERLQQELSAIRGDEVEKKRTKGRDKEIKAKLKEIELDDVSKFKSI